MKLHIVVVVVVVGGDITENELILYVHNMYTYTILYIHIYNQHLFNQIFFVAHKQLLVEISSEHLGERFVL